jgi:hypothetical protein
MLSKDTIDKYCQTFVGRPLIIKHSRVTPQTMENSACGYITDVWYNTQDGWYWCKGTCFNEEAKDLIRKGFFVSCSYKVENLGPGGEFHAIKYDEEILNFTAEHLAIVENPRYEGATIRLNSKNKPTMSMFKWFKKSSSKQNASEAPAAPAATPTAAAPAAADETAEDIQSTTVFEIQNAKGEPERVTLGELVEARNKDNATASDEDEFVVNGKPVKFASMVAAYNKQNAADEEELKKKNEAEEKEKKEKEAKENAKVTAPSAKPDFFRMVANASSKANVNEGPKTSVDSMDDRLARGNALYGTKPSNN